jgi:hypothetical protein
MKNIFVKVLIHNFVPMRILILRELDNTPLRCSGICSNPAKKSHYILKQYDAYMTKYNCFANAASNYTTTFRSDLGLDT